MGSHRLLPWLIVALSAPVVASGVVWAEGFRVDSQVFIGKETTPHSTNATIFQGAHVYDFLDQPRQITIYDLVRGRIVLLDPSRMLKAEVAQTMLEAFCENLRRGGKQTADPVLRFALDPRFEESSADSEGERIFSSKHITYRVKPLAGESAGMAATYRTFGDASARLNAFVNRGSLPPFPRLVVNESLAKSGHLPAEVHLTVSPGRLGGGRRVVLRSKHTFRRRLLDSDLRMIDEAGELLGKAAPVLLGEYLQPGRESGER